LEIIKYLQVVDYIWNVSPVLFCRKIIMCRYRVEKFFLNTKINTFNFPNHEKGAGTPYWRVSSPKSSAYVISACMAKGLHRTLWNALIIHALYQIIFPTNENFVIWCLFFMHATQSVWTFNRLVWSPFYIKIYIFQHYSIVNKFKFLKNSFIIRLIK
jgi:hypothetical protein